MPPLKAPALVKLRRAAGGGRSRLGEIAVLGACATVLTAWLALLGWLAAWATGLV